VRSGRPAGVFGAVLAGLVGLVGLAAPPAAAGARRLPVSVGGQRPVCPPPTRAGQMQCMSIKDVRQAGYTPASLRSAYGLSRASLRRGGGETVAIVDAYSDPNAASDLARYRSHYGLPPCGTSNRCLRIVNEHGHPGPFPRPMRNWAFEESIDLDMISAICPRCHILLVEAHSNTTTDLGIAEDTAVAMGARFVSNSWNTPEFDGERAFDHYFNHPGVAITFAAGDSGYGTSYPTDIRYVTAVGGTTLRRADNRRGWSESVWPGTGSGCSAFEAKAPWQTQEDIPNGCVNRTGNDVAADANVATGVSIYDSYQSGGTWLLAGGTSVATPIIAAVFALAGRPTPGTYPARYPYLHVSHLYDVTMGSNGTCEPDRRYLCHAEPGYDGPTGLGTPAGIAAFSN
jgi:subtilase family serine protease